MTPAGSIYPLRCQRSSTTPPWQPTTQFASECEPSDEGEQSKRFLMNALLVFLFRVLFFLIESQNIIVYFNNLVAMKEEF
jgi:hypothetical protein